MFKIFTDGKSVGSAPHDLKEVCIDEESSSSGGSSGLGLVVELQRERRG